MQNRDPPRLRYSCWGMIPGRPTGKRGREGLERPRYDGGSAASRAAPACPHALPLSRPTLSEIPHHAPLPHPSRRPDPRTLAQHGKLNVSSLTGLDSYCTHPETPGELLPRLSLAPDSASLLTTEVTCPTDYFHYSRIIFLLHRVIQISGYLMYANPIILVVKWHIISIQHLTRRHKRCVYFPDDPKVQTSRRLKSQVKLGSKYFLAPTCVYDA